MRKAIIAISLFGVAATAAACLWDADTLADERKVRPKMAEAILGPPPKPADPKPLMARIETLKANARENDPAWWNDLAGALIRLGRTKEAVELLESAVKRFPDDYGVHANLGTAYHLLGRYQDAEKEIARDLEINPEAHFGLEKYHLALLQYLSRDAAYQARHLYVDEFTVPFWQDGVFIDPWHNQYLGLLETNAPSREVAEATYKTMKQSNVPFGTNGLERAIVDLVVTDPPPSYRKRWELDDAPKLEDGAIYMATLNPQQPACFVMLGVLSLKNKDKNLAAAAFEKAIQLGSPQADFLRFKIGQIRTHITEARSVQHKIESTALSVALVPLTALVCLCWFYFRYRRRRAHRAAPAT